jgi:hypothetical protein
MTARKAATVGPGNKEYDAAAARLIASLRKEDRKPVKRAPSARPAARSARKQNG